MTQLIAVTIWHSARSRVPQIAVKFTRSVSTVSANFRESSRKTAKQFEKLKRSQIIYWSHFRDDTQNFANLGKSRLFTFESSAFNRTQPPFLLVFSAL
jgi:hypothetical protein